MSTLGVPEHNGKLETARGSDSDFSRRPCPRCGVSIVHSSISVCDRCKQDRHIINCSLRAAGVYQGD